jgi:hypothetical protein
MVNGSSGASLACGALEQEVTRARQWLLRRTSMTRRYQRCAHRSTSGGRERGMVMVKSGDDLSSVR